MSTRTPALVRPRARAFFVAALLFASLLLSLVGGQQSADAHALVNATFPADGAVLDVAPQEVSLNFNEGVDAPSAALRVYNDEGARVDAGDASVDPQDDTRIRVALEQKLRDGTYVVTWRAVSADGHPIKGAWLFSLGEGGEIGEDLVAALFSSSGDRPLAMAAIAVRGFAIGGVLLLAGLGLFSWTVGRDERRVTTADRAALVPLARVAAFVALSAAALSVPLQAMLETGLGFSALTARPLWDVLSSPVGLSSVARVLVSAIVIWMLARSRPPAIGAGVVGLGVVGVLSLVFEGHSLTQNPIGVIFAADVVHVLSAAAWGGGLVALLVLVRRRRRSDDPIGAAQLVASFSRLATWSLLALTIAGSTMGWVTVRAARALTSTGYGWTLLAKVSLVAALAVVGLYNNRRLVPAVTRAAAIEGSAPGADIAPEVTAAAAGDLARRIGDGAWVRLRQTLRIEAFLMAAVVAVTALLVGQQPASQDAGVTGAYTTYLDLTDDLEVNIVVDPNRAGLNEIHLYLLDRTGRPASSEQVTFILEQPENDLGPFERTPTVTGPGHWSLAGRELAVPGEWNITIVVRIDRFNEERITIPVVVNR
ncbi:MAG: copper transport protein [Glaciecola sp.]|jgi:copper transport protein